MVIRPEIASRSDTKVEPITPDGMDKQEADEAMSMDPNGVKNDDGMF